MKLPFPAAILLLTACAAAPQNGNTPAAETASAETAVPYPAPDLQSQIDSLGTEIARLNGQIEALQTRIKRLEHPNRRAAPVRTAEAAPSAAALPAPDPLATARKQYRSGNYAAAARLLQASESGGSGSPADRQGMHLLLQSHQKLGNCQSVINIGNRYVSRFRNSPEAADTLFAVGQCQWNIQQRDVARDTWRKLMRLYPASAAAKKAAQHADKY